MKIEEYANRIAALVPRYGPDGGNDTLVYTMDGEIIEDRRTVRWIVKKIARHYMVDLEALRKRCAEYLSMSQVPLPLSAELVLVPLKMRRIVAEKDGAHGYVNPLAVKEIKATSDNKEKSKDAPAAYPNRGKSLVGALKHHKEKSKDISAAPAGDGGTIYRSQIILANGQELPCCFSPRTTERRVKAGIMLKERFYPAPGFYITPSINMARTMVKEKNPADDLSAELLILIAKMLSAARGVNERGQY